MTERQWWSRVVRPMWHRPLARYLAIKVEDKFKSGVPDVDLCLRGIGAKCELKMETRGDLPPNSLDAAKLVTPGQQIALFEWTTAGGSAWVVVGHEPTKTATVWDAKRLLKNTLHDPVVVAYYGSRPKEKFSSMPLSQLPALFHKIALENVLEASHGPKSSPLEPIQDIEIQD